MPRPRKPAEPPPPRGYCHGSIRKRPGGRTVGTCRTVTTVDLKRAPETTLGVLWSGRRRRFRALPGPDRSQDCSQVAEDTSQ
jgi:hypothetical protein